MWHRWAGLYRNNIYWWYCFHRGIRTGAIKCHKQSSREARAPNKYTHTQKDLHHVTWWQQINLAPWEASIGQVHEFKYWGSFISASMIAVSTNAAAQIGNVQGAFASWPCASRRRKNITVKTKMKCSHHASLALWRRNMDNGEETWTLLIEEAAWSGAELGHWKKHCSLLTFHLVMY